MMNRCVNSQEAKEPRNTGIVMFVVLLFVSLFAISCGDDGAAPTVETTIEGPAFVLFFTDP